jgi:hypothetical protein
MQVKNTSTTQNTHDQNTTTLQDIINKRVITKNKKRILKATREKNQITYKFNSLK